MKYIIEATIYWTDEPNRLINVLFGVGFDYPESEEWDHKIFYYLDYPEEIKCFMDGGIEDFVVKEHHNPKPINEVFV